MKVLQFPAQQSSGADGIEATVRRQLLEVMDTALESIAEAILSKPLESGAEACEQRISAALAEAGCGALRVALESGDTDAEQLERDGKKYHRVSRQRTTMMSTFGEVAYERHRYRRRGRASIAPANERFQVLFDWWSPLAARQATFAAAMLPPGQCTELFEELGGMKPSATALDNLVRGLGPVLEVLEEDAVEAVREAEGLPETAAVLAVSIDGAMIGMRKEKAVPEQEDEARPAGFREASSGTVSLIDVDGKRLRSACFARMPEPGKATLKRDVQAEVEYCLQQKPELECVFITDAAADNWSWCEEVFPNALQIYDYFHSTQHLKDALDAAYGDGSSKAQRQFERLREILRDDPKGIDKVLRFLRQLARKHPQRGTIPRVIRFFRKQRKRMQYAEFQALGYPIGSGVVEAANKVLIAQRLKCSGMRWSETGTGQAILSFRALWKSGRFHAMWKEILQAFEPEPCKLRHRSGYNMLNLARC